jgi:hypothetical protein
MVTNDQGSAARGAHSVLSCSESTVMEKSISKSSGDSLVACNPMLACPPTRQALRLMRPSGLSSNGINFHNCRISVFLQSLMQRLSCLFHNE